MAKKNLNEVIKYEELFPTVLGLDPRSSDAEASVLSIKQIRLALSGDRCWRYSQVQTLHS